MKKILIILLALAICFSGCWNVEIVDPREETVSLEKEPETEEISEEFVEEIILNFGAEKESDGTYRVVEPFSFYFGTGDYEDFKIVDTSANSLYGMGAMLGKEYIKEIYVSDLKYDVYEAETFENMVYKYFGISEEVLKNTIHYNEFEELGEAGYYWLDGPYYIDENPSVKLLGFEKIENLIYIYLTVDYNDDSQDKSRNLIIKLLPDGGYNYVSYVSYKTKDEYPEPEKVYFRFDEAEEPKTLSVGDYFGEWKLENLEIDYDESGSAMIDSIDADFSGNLTMAGYIELSPLSVPFYEFIPSEYDLSRIPGAVAGGFKEKFSHFGLKIPEGLGNSPNLDHGETLPCIIKVSGYHLSRAYTEGVDFFDVVEIKPIGSKVELSPLQKEIILNFGAREAEFGTIRSNKTTSLYFNTEGFSDGTKLNETSYFSWVMFYLGKEYDYETQKELFTGAGEGMGWAFPSEYYEPAVYKYFGVPAEELRKSEIYNPEKDYYNIPFGGGIGDYPYIVVNSIDETEEKVVFHITLVHIIEKNIDMDLTVKLLPDGGYNYVSYLPE